MAGNNIDVEEYSTLYKIFTRSKWNEHPEHEIIFRNFCTLLGNLTTEQKKLILDLTGRYLWITSAEYEKRLGEVLNKIEDEKLKNCKKIYLLPIVRPEDEGKVKSAMQLLYLFHSFAVLYNPKFLHIEFIPLAKLEYIQSGEVELKEGELIFMVDDFLGSGETIKAAVEFVLSNQNIDKNSLNIISLVAQSDAIKFLEQFNFNYYVGTIKDKGISEYYQSPEKEKQIEVMKSIENLINERHFSFGYNGSEALVTMIRTPDNTFPIFWGTYKKKRKELITPFARYK